MEWYGLDGSALGWRPWEGSSLIIEKILSVCKLAASQEELRSMQLVKQKNQCREIAHTLPHLYWGHLPFSS
jgi:hypothetical protein